MQDAKLKTAVLGLGDDAGIFLNAADALGLFEIKAIGDTNISKANEIAQQYKCAYFDDYRQLITASPLDCLFVDAGVQDSEDYIRLAIKKGVNILKSVPMAKSFESAASLVKLAQEYKVKFAIADTRRFDKNLLTLDRFIADCKAGQIFLISAFYKAQIASEPAWRTDPKTAGGGVLLYDCWHVFDQIIRNFGLPQQIYATAFNTDAGRPQRIQLAENVAVITMKFSHTLAANILVCRYAQACNKEEFIKIYGKNGLIINENCRTRLCQSDGTVIEEFSSEGNEDLKMRRLLENFSLTITSGGEHKLVSNASDNLKTMAAIESAYLSARTGMPEQPSLILNMAGDLTHVLNSEQR